MKTLSLALALLILGIGAAACGTGTMTVTSPPTTITVTTTAVVTGTVPDGTGPAYSLMVLEMHQEFSKLEFSGTAVCPDGTVLRSRLFEDNEPLPWWPADEDILVANGEWSITFTLGTNGSPPLVSHGPVYEFKVRVKDFPGISGSFIFDLIGPPPLSTVAPPWPGIPVYTFYNNEISTSVNGEFAIQLPGPLPDHVLLWTDRDQGNFELLDQDSVILSPASTELPPPYDMFYLFKALKAGTFQMEFIETSMPPSPTYSMYSFRVTVA